MRYLDFGSCPGGDVRGYSFVGQKKVTTYTNTNPDTDAYQMVWTWLQNRQKPFGQGQLGPHEGTLQYCNATMTPSQSWTYQREDCDLNAAFTTADAQYTITMPVSGRISAASSLALTASVLLAAAVLLA